MSLIITDADPITNLFRCICRKRGSRCAGTLGASRTGKGRGSEREYNRRVRARARVRVTEKTTGNKTLVFICLDPEIKTVESTPE